MKTVGTIAAAILIFFGVIFILGTFGKAGQLGWLIVGIVLAGIGLALIFILQRPQKPTQSTNVTMKVDLPGNVSMDVMKCKSCGGTLSAENIKMVNGAPMVTCPYCNTVYQLTEDPKW